MHRNRRAKLIAALIVVAVTSLGAMAARSVVASPREPEPTTSEGSSGITYCGIDLSLNSYIASLPDVYLVGSSYGQTNLCGINSIDIYDPRAGKSQYGILLEDIGPINIYDDYWDDPSSKDLTCYSVPEYPPPQ